MPACPACFLFYAAASITAWVALFKIAGIRLEESKGTWPWAPSTMSALRSRVLDGSCWMVTGSPSTHLHGICFQIGPRSPCSARNGLHCFAAPSGGATDP